MFVDTHTHFYDEWLLEDADAAVQRALAAGVGKMIQADVDSHERKAMWEVGSRYPGVIFQMLGLYPGSVDATWREELDLVHSIAQTATACHKARPEHNSEPSPKPGPKHNPKPILEPNPKPSHSPQGQLSPATACHPEEALVKPASPTRPERFVAIGEIGLDYHEGKEFVKEQKEVLRIQLELAARMDLPVNIHLRDAWEDLFAVLKDCKHLNIRGNLHCFTASYEVYERANQYADFSVGIGGVVTFKNASLARTLERIPMEKILLETDAPYLAPVPFRGRRNESAYLPYIAAKVADIKNLPLPEIEQITTRNAETLFGI